MKLPPAKTLLVILAIALGLRLAAGWWWQSRLDEPFAMGDSHGYWTMARNVAHGELHYGGPDSRVFRAPGYPVLLSPIFLLAGDEPRVFWARVLSAVLDTLSVAAVAWLAWMLFNSQAAIVAAAMAAVYPGSIAVGVMVLSEAPFCPFMLLNLGLWIAAWEHWDSGPRRSTWLAVLAGMAAGAATLMRPSWLLFLPFAVLLGLVFSPARRRHFAIGGLMFVGLVLAMTPWWVRNARVTGHFVPTTLQVGASLYDGISPTATGASEMSFVPRFEAEERAREAADPSVRSEPFEYRLDRRMRDAAVDWAAQHPGRVIELAAIKFFRMWNVWPNEPSMSSPPVRLVVLLTYVPILVLGLLGAVRTLRLGWPYILCWLPAVYFTLLHVVFVSSIRYRQPAMLGLMVLAAGVVSQWLGQRREKTLTAAT